MRRMSASAASASAASTSRENSAPNAAASVPASAGPVTRAALKLAVSRAFAGTSRSSGTIVGMRLVKPPKESG
jgi:hypothetical protein